MKIKFFKKEKVFKKGGFHTNPDIGWEIVLYISFVLVLGSFVFGFFLFQRVDEEFTPTANSTEARIIDREKMGKVLEYFAEREEKSSEIINSPSPFVDPSR